jgi:hypothetical protein
MTALNEKERYLVSLALQIVEAEKVVFDPDSKNEAIVEAENKGDELREQYELARTAFQFNELPDLQRKLG